MKRVLEYFGYFVIIMAVLITLALGSAVISIIGITLGFVSNAVMALVLCIAAVKALFRRGD